MKMVRQRTLRKSMLICSCNPGYLGGRDQEDGNSRPSQAKSYRDSISINKLGVVAWLHNPTIWEAVGRKILVRG
jgi:hypothetical protein